MREAGGDTTDGEAADAAMYTDVVWRHEGISLFMDLDNSDPQGVSGNDFDLWFGFSSARRSDLYCARSHRTPPEDCSQERIGGSVVATSGSLQGNDRMIEAAIRWADIEAGVDRNRLPGGFLPVLKPGLRIGSEPLLLDDGSRHQAFIGGDRTRKPNGKDANSRDILLTE